MWSRDRIVSWPLREKHEAKARPVPAFSVHSSRPFQPITVLSPSPLPPSQWLLHSPSVSVSSSTSHPVAAASELGAPACSLLLMPHVQGFYSLPVTSPICSLAILTVPVLAQATVTCHTNYLSVFVSHFGCLRQSTCWSKEPSLGHLGGSMG